MTAAEPVFIDTNVLVYAARTLAAQHAAAVAAFEAAAGRQAPLWISRQVIREYLAAMTRPQPAMPTLPVTEALADAKRLEQRFNVADETAMVTGHLIQLLEKVPAAGKQVHDANIVATMLAHGIPRLLTFNVADFRRFEPLIAIEPLP
jgi:predicted nucleic acid-binding protein